MLLKLGGFGLMLMLLSLPLHAEHRHYSRHDEHGRRGAGFIEFQVGTPYVSGVFVRGFRSAPRYYQEYPRYYDGPPPRYYERYEPRFDERRYKHRRWYKRHRHFHYDDHCPY